MAVKQKPEKSQTQSDKFHEAARNLGADESEAVFDRALLKVAISPPQPKPKKSKPSKDKEMI